MKLLLSIDGGGIRGIVPAVILDFLEAALDSASSNIFDLIGGTSTGGIIACGLGAGASARSLWQMYKSNGESIFTRAPFRPRAFVPKYSPEGLTKAVDEFFGAHVFRNSNTKIIIPAYDIIEDHTSHFKSWDDPWYRLTRDVALATSAAPTYFPAHNGYIDGGVFANDPAMNVLAEAESLWPGEDKFLLSLGTGHAPRPNRLPKSGGLAQWAMPILSLLMDGPQQDVQYMVKNTIQGHYMRISGALPPNVDPAMDNASEENISRLIEFGTNLANTIDMNKIRDIIKIKEIEK